MVFGLWIVVDWRLTGQWREINVCAFSCIAVSNERRGKERMEKISDPRFNLSINSSCILSKLIRSSKPIAVYDVVEPWTQQ